MTTYIIITVMALANAVFTIILFRRDSYRKEVKQMHDDILAFRKEVTKIMEKK